VVMSLAFGQFQWMERPPRGPSRSAPGRMKPAAVDLWLETAPGPLLPQLLASVGGKGGTAALGDHGRRSLPLMAEPWFGAGLADRGGAACAPDAVCAPANPAC